MLDLVVIETNKECLYLQVSLDTVSYIFIVKFATHLKSSYEEMESYFNEHSMINSLATVKETT